MFQSTMSNGTIKPKGKTFKLKVAQLRGGRIGSSNGEIWLEKETGPAASVVVTLGGKGTQILGSRWTVQGGLGEVNLRAATYYGEKEYNYGIGMNLKDITVFKFCHKHRSQNPNSIMRWVMDGNDLGSGEV